MNFKGFSINNIFPKLIENGIFFLIEKNDFLAIQMKKFYTLNFILPPSLIFNEISTKYDFLEILFIMLNN